MCRSLVRATGLFVVPLFYSLLHAHTKLRDLHAISGTHTLAHITRKTHSLTHNSFTAHTHTHTHAHTHTHTHTQSSVLLYHCKKGELSHSWSGRLVEQQLGNETANMSRTIVDGIIQLGDSDPEFAGIEREKERKCQREYTFILFTCVYTGRFVARQILAAFTPEELLEEEFAKSKSPVPRYSMEHLTGIWCGLKLLVYEAFSY